MEFLDEKIIRARSEMNRMSKNQDIRNGVVIKGKTVKFNEVLLFEGKISILLPTTFEDMPEQAMKVKYQSENRPQIIKSNPEYSVDFTFSHLRLPLSLVQVQEVLQGMKNMLVRAHPANIIYEEKVESLEDSKIAWFDFKGYALDGETYSLMFITPLHGFMLLGIFNCGHDDYGEWKQIAYQVMMSLKKLQQEAENER